MRRFRHGVERNDDALLEAPRQEAGCRVLRAARRYDPCDSVAGCAATGDREVKRDAYLALAVREVWLVDLQEKSVEVCLEAGVAILAQTPGAAQREKYASRAARTEVDGRSTKRRRTNESSNDMSSRSINRAA